MRFWVCLALYACGGDAATPDGDITGDLPVLASVDPSVIAVGAPATTVHLMGSAFAADATIVWDGAPREATSLAATDATFELAADDLAAPGSHEVAIINPGGGISAPLLVEVAFGNPVPAITVLSPDHAPVGSAGFALDVVGTDFAIGAHLTFGGTDRATTRVDATHLTAMLTDADLAAVAQVDVAVINPGPGGGASAPRAFAVEPPASPAGVLERVSVTDAGAQLQFDSKAIAVSTNGRCVAFTAYDGVVASDTNSRTDLFVRDTCRGATGCTPTTIPVSVKANGTFSTSGAVGFAAASADLRYLAFQGPQDLVAGAPVSPVYVRDTCIGASGACTPLTMVASDPGAFTNTGVDISNDGRYVAYGTVFSYAAADTNNTLDIYVYDTCRGATGCTPQSYLVSQTTAGVAGNGQSSHPSISASGRYVAFTSFASDLVTGDTNATFDVFVRDTCIGATGCTPTTVIVSVDSAGAIGSGQSNAASIDATGRYVAFQSLSPLAASDHNTGSDIYLRDTCAGASSCTPSTTLVSIKADGTAVGTAQVERPRAVSSGGRYVVFDTRTNGVVTADTDGFDDVFVRDVCTGVAACTPSNRRVSVGPGAVAPDRDALASGPALGADGRFVTFGSAATNLVAGDTNTVEDAFLAASGF